MSLTRTSWILLAGALAFAPPAGVAAVDSNSDPAHVCRDSERPLAWPDGIIPYDLSHLSQAQQILARQAMQRWINTGARIAFVPRTSQTAYVNFTGRTD